MDSICKLSKGISRRLKKLRGDKTQAQVIQEIGEHNLSLRSLKSYESAEAKMIDLDKLITLANYYHVSLDYLVRGIQTLDLDDYTWANLLKMLNRCIGTYMVVPQKMETGFLAGKYALIVPDSETNYYLDKATADLAINNLMHDTLKERWGSLVEKLDSLIGDFAFSSGELVTCKERLEKVEKELGIDRLRQEIKNKE